MNENVQLKGFLLSNKLELVEKMVDNKECVTLLDDVSNGAWYIDKRLHKFPDDEVVYSDNNTFLLLDGHIDNKKELLKENLMQSWESIAFHMISRGEISKFRGGFCGVCFDNSRYQLFVDHVGNKSLYYYCQNGILVVASKLYDIIDLLKTNGLVIHVDEMAIKYLMSLGFMPDNSTVCNEIKRVCPGDIVEIGEELSIKCNSYYRPDNTKVNHNMSWKEAIEGLDFYFSQAIDREFGKDIEYGYRHLVDLSGGLDSRMTSVVANELGYTDQINIAYCQKGYLDYKIAQEIACDMKHKFIFMPLDDFKWFKDVEINSKMLNSAVPYAGATGARHMLDIIKGCNCGIEHTGMVGDAIIGTFYSDEQYNYSKPDGMENAYSTSLNYNVPKEVLNEFLNREQFSIYTRGLLGAQSSYMLRQNYFETASPFLDVDFLDFILSVPFNYRVKHKIYLAWIASKYPIATRYGWEKWHGAKPTERGRKLEKKAYQLKYSISAKLSSVLPLHIGMTPVDYWLNSNPDIEEYINNYFENAISFCSEVISKELYDDMVRLYKTGNVGEKEQVLTASAAIKMMFE